MIMKKMMLVLITSACGMAFAMNALAQQPADQATAEAVIAPVPPGCRWRGARC